MTESARIRHRALLMGKVLRRVENQADTGYFWERSKALFLHHDLSFRYVVRTASSVSAGGLSLPSDKETVAEGRWSVEIRGFTCYLVLKQDGVEVLSWRSEDRGASLHRLDSENWHRYLIR